jgi:two-component system, sensor histidine kinase and response regulator
MKNNDYLNDCSERSQHTAIQKLSVKDKSDQLMNYFLISFFIGGLLLAFFFDTWLIAVIVGGLLLTAYYSAKIILPHSNLYQYVLSVVLALFIFTRCTACLKCTFSLLSAALFLLRIKTGNCKFPS